jgi:CRP/FNR family transcriptional regulator
MDAEVEARDPLTWRLSRYLSLTFDERGALSRLMTESVRLKPRARLVQEAKHSDRMFVLRSGWLHASTILKGGARQILRIHQPGDLVNTSCLAWTRVVATITAVTEAEVWPFPRDQLSVIFRSQPRLAALLYGISIAENVALCDRLKSLGRTDAEARLGALLLELLSRQRITSPQDGNSFELFLTQTDLADAVGLTKVHVNRVLRKMTESGLIERDGRLVRIPDVARLAELSGFIDRHAEVATEWLP